MIEPQSHRRDSSLYIEHLRNWKIDILLVGLISALYNSEISYHAFTFDGRYIIEPAFALAILAGGGKIFLEGCRIGHRYSWLLFSWVFFIVLSACLGYFNYSNILSVYGNFRALMVFSIVMVFGFRFCLLPDGMVRLHALAVWGLALSLVVSRIFGALDGGESIKSAVPMILGVLAVSIALGRNDITAMLLDLVLVVLAAASSYFRSYYLCALLISFLVLYGMMRVMLSKGVSVWKRIVIPLILYITIVGAGVALERFMRMVEADESSYIQSVGKTTELINFLRGDSELAASEQSRMENLDYIVSNFARYIIPSGLGNDASGVSVDGMRSFITRDMAFLFLVVHLGTASLLFVVAVTLSIHWYLLSVGRGVEAVISLLILTVYALTSSEFFTVVTKAVAMGLYVGYLLAICWSGHVRKRHAPRTRSLIGAPSHYLHIDSGRRIHRE